MVFMQLINTMPIVVVLGVVVVVVVMNGALIK